jgi:hypothetical protein
MNYGNSGDIEVHGFEGGRGFLGQPDGEPFSVYLVGGTAVGRLDPREYVSSGRLPHEVVIIGDMRHERAEHPVYATPVRDEGAIRTLANRLLMDAHRQAGIEIDDDYATLMRKMGRMVGVDVPEHFFDTSPILEKLDTFTPTIGSADSLSTRKEVK